MSVLASASRDLFEQLISGDFDFFDIGVVEKLDKVRNHKPVGMNYGEVVLTNTVPELELVGGVEGDRVGLVVVRGLDAYNGDGTNASDLRLKISKKSGGNYSDYLTMLRRWLASQNGWDWEVPPVGKGWGFVSGTTESIVVRTVDIGSSTSWQFHISYFSAWWDV